MRTQIAITPLLPGEKIQNPGIYDLPMSIYHGDCCVGHSISSTGIRRVVAQSLRRYWWHSTLNPDRPEDDSTEAMTLGRAAHHLFLGEAGFKDHFVLRPDEAPDGRAWNGNNLSCKKWLGEQVLAGRAVITKVMLEKIRGMAASLASNVHVKEGMLNGLVEKSLIWLDEETGLWLKARPDAVPPK